MEKKGFKKANESCQGYSDPKSNGDTKRSPAIDGQWQGAVKESHRAWDDETAGEQKKKAAERAS